MKSKGFVLIELIIVLILFSVSLALAVPFFSRVSKTAELKGTAQKISGILRYGRSEAVNEGKVYQVLFNADLREVRIKSVESTEEEGTEEEKTVDEKAGDGKTGDEKAKEKKAYDKVYSMPGWIHMKEVEIPAALYDSDLPAIEFYPNGSSNGGSFLLDGEEQKGYRIKVHFLSGIVEIERL
jgi:prepilin-type N-terminal cleavage/methylation domain-containing protein